MEEIKYKSGPQSDEDFGFLLWQLESLEKFYPCFTTMIKKG
jgi:hypothetical protein